MANESGMGGYDYVLKIGADGSAIANEILKSYVDAQKKVNKEGEITIRLSADPKQLNEEINKLLRQNPQVGTTLKFEYDSKSYEQQMKLLNSLTQKKGEEIGKTFSKEINKGFENIKGAKWNEILNGRTHLDDVKKYISGLKESLGEFSFDNANFKDMYEYARKLGEIQSLMQKVNGTKRANWKNTYTDTDFKFINDFYDKAGARIGANGSSMFTQLETDAKKSLDNIIEMMAKLSSTSMNDGFTQDLTKDIGRLTEETKTLENQIESVQKKINKVAPTLSGFLSNLDSYDKKESKNLAGQLLYEYDYLEKNLNSQKELNQLKEVKGYIDSIREDKALYTVFDNEELKKSREELEGLKRELDFKQSQIGKMNAYLGQKDINDSLSKNEINSELQKQGQIIKQLSEEAEGYKNQLKSAKEEIKNTGSELKKINAENKTLKDQIKNISNNKSDNSTDITKLKRELEELEKNYKKVREEAEKYKKQLDDIADSNALKKANNNIEKYDIDLLAQATKAITKEKNFSKAAAYYGIYRDKGGNEDLIVNETNLTEKLLQKYKEMLSVKGKSQEATRNELNLKNKELTNLNEQIKTLKAKLAQETRNAQETEKIAKNMENISKASKNINDINDDVANIMKSLTGSGLFDNIKTTTSNTPINSSKDSIPSNPTISNITNSASSKKATTIPTSFNIDIAQEIARIQEVVSKSGKKINLDVELNTPKFEDNKKTNFTDLQEAIKKVTKSVNDKTEAFKNEETAVSSMVQNEVADIEKLLEPLKKVEGKLKEISEMIGSIPPLEIKSELFNKDNLIKIDKASIASINSYISSLTKLNELIAKEDIQKNLMNLAEGLKALNIEKIEGINIKDLNLSALVKYAKNYEDIVNLAVSLETLSDSIKTLSGKTIDLSGLKISSKNVSNMENMAYALDIVKDSLKTFDSKAKKTLIMLKELTSQASALKQLKAVTSTTTSSSKGSKSNNEASQQSAVNKALVSQLSAWKAIQNIREEIAKTDANDTAKLENLENEKKAYQQQYVDAQKVLRVNQDLYNQTEQQAKLDLERLETNERINKFKLNNTDVNQVINKATSDLMNFKKRKNQSEDYKNAINKLSEAITNLRALENSRVKSKLLADDEAEKINDATASIKKYTTEIRNMSAVEKGSKEVSRNDLANKIHDYMSKNTRMSREFREELENLIRTLRTGGDSVNVTDIAAQFSDVRFRIKEAKQEGISFFDIFKNKAVYGFAARLAQYYLSFYDFIRYARNAVNVIRELDNALIDLKKTTAMNTSQMESFYFEANDVAKEMGVTTQAIIEQASAWSRLGYNTKEASTEMAKLSSKFAAISPGMDTESAQEGLVSIMKAFDIDVVDVETEIMDKINILGKFILPKHTVMCGV